MPVEAHQVQNQWLFEQLVATGASQPRCSVVEAALLASGPDLACHRAWWVSNMQEDRNLAEAFVAFAQKLLASGEVQSQSPVHSLESALDVCGPSTARLWVLVELLDRLFPPSQSELVLLRQHSLQVAAAAAVIAHDVGQVSPGELFFGGLLHDVAQVLLINHGGDAYADVMKSAVNLGEAEYELLGFDHGELGAELGKAWGLPRPLASMMRDHHILEPRLNQVAVGSHLRRVACLTLAERLVGGMAYSLEASPEYVADLQGARQVLGLRMSEMRGLEKRCISAITAVQQALAGRSKSLFVPVPLAVRELWGWGNKRWSSERDVKLPSFQLNPLPTQA